MRLVPHSPADLMGARDVPGPRFHVAHDFLRRLAEACSVPKLGCIAIDRLPLTGDVKVCAVPQLPVDLPDAIRNLLACEHALATLCLGVWHCVHVGVLLEVHHGAEEEIPNCESKGPISPKLGFHSPGHASGPVLDVYMRCISVAGLAAWERIELLDAVLGGINDIGAGRGMLEAEGEGNRKVVGLELVKELIARSHLDVLRCCGLGLFLGLRHQCLARLFQSR